ncbi:protein translocase subunit SecF [Candidatus Gottesmanbacteria bacterium]|nr:protein translocase subunit SecF [Candidatus Gottesmanbacteria bacterium]
MIRFSKYILLYFLFSGVFLAVGMYSLARFGLKQSIDFTGGALLEMKVADTTTQTILEDIGKKQNMAIASMQKSYEKTYVLRIKPEDAEKVTVFVDEIKKIDKEAQLLRRETVGPILGKELLMKAVSAAIIAMIGILLYVAYAFKNIKFGVSAIIALFHDLLMVLGVFSLLGHLRGVEVDTLFVTAFLTTMSFSVHDTIVVFDRIREYLKRGVKLSFEETCDLALTETMGRSTTNSFTIIFMLFALVLLGGDTVRWFTMALLVGTISGTYSSPFIATPVLILWDRWEKRKN